MNALAAVARIIPLAGVWQNIGAPYAPKLVIIQQTPEGLFTLFGALTAATTPGALIATLPDDALPFYQTPGAARMDGATVDIVLLKNGQIRLATPPAGPVGGLHISTLFYGA